jgi:hypothetical protein
MWWLCGAFCDSSRSALQAQLDYIASKVPQTTHISVGSWVVGNDGVSISEAPGYLNFAQEIRSKGFTPVGYIFTETPEKMLNAFQDPGTFAQNAIRIARAAGYDGVELD